MGDKADREPVAELDDRFSSPGASPTSWADAVDLLNTAKVYWLATVREDGRPHVTSVAGVWLDGAVYVTTGEDEQKARNLTHKTNCVVTTGCNVLEGLDVVVEAEAVRETDPTRLQALADAYRAKYGDLFLFTVRDGVLRQEEAAGEVVAYRLQAQKMLGFGKGEQFTQTRWRFAPA
jgi:pyridoxamine 5'-phosphate oxidase-like protein